MKETIISIVIAVVLIAGAVFLTRGNTNNSQNDVSNNAVTQNNVSVVSGTQIIDLRAKGGFTPIKSTAKAGLPTVLRVNTDGTIDCSAIVRIPSMDITKNLPPSGETEISIGTSTVGVLHGTCGMGMYPFEINFQI